MKSLKNNIQLIGYLTEDPEITNFQNGRKMAKFNIISLTKIKNDKETLKIHNKHNIVAWNKVANIAEKNLITGIEVIIEGKPIYDNINHPRQISEILAESIAYRNIKYAISINNTINIENRA